MKQTETNREADTYMGRQRQAETSMYRERQTETHTDDVQAKINPIVNFSHTILLYWLTMQII